MMPESWMAGGVGVRVYRWASYRREKEMLIGGNWLAYIDNNKTAKKNSKERITSLKYTTFKQNNQLFV